MNSTRAGSGADQPLPAGEGLGVSSRDGQEGAASGDQDAPGRSPLATVTLTMLLSNVSMRRIDAVWSRHSKAATTSISENATRPIVLPICDRVVLVLPEHDQQVDRDGHEQAGQPDGRR